MSSVSQKKNPTKNQLRKWEKKLRNAKTEEAKNKAEQMIRIHSPKPPTTDKVHGPTDDELMAKLIKENKRLFKDKQEKQKNERKKLSLEKDRQENRKQILKVHKEKEKEKTENKVKLEKFREEFKKKQEEFKQQSKTHLDKVLEIVKEQEVKDKLTDRYIKTKMTNDANQEALLEKRAKIYKKHQRKIDRDYNSYLENMCMKMERLVQMIMKDKEVTYEEAVDVVYSN